jgi:hypothetical protein
MSKQTTRALLIALACFLLLVGTAWAISSAQHAINWHVIGDGGGTASSAHYAVRATVGQSAIGPAAGSEHRVGAGYWYGVGRDNEIYLPLLMRNTQ